MRGKKLTKRREEAKISFDVGPVNLSNQKRKLGVTTFNPSLTQKKAGKTGKSTLKGCSPASKDIKCSAIPVTTKKQNGKISNGKLLNGKGAMVHDPDRCKDEWCALHNPSNHKMVTWDRYLRSDKYWLIERICPTHGVGHPDPDSLAYFKAHGLDLGMHGCCGCCCD